MSRHQSLLIIVTAHCVHSVDNQTINNQCLSIQFDCCCSRCTRVAIVPSTRNQKYRTICLSLSLLSFKVCFMFTLLSTPASSYLLFLLRAGCVNVSSSTVAMKNLLEFILLHENSAHKLLVYFTNYKYFEYFNRRMIIRNSLQNILRVYMNIDG